jgi:hypothetical protein
MGGMMGRGAAGAGGPGGMGGMMGRGGMGGPGGMPGMDPTAMGAIDNQEELDQSAIRADIVIELSALKRAKGSWEMYHKWGKTKLYQDEDIKPYRLLEERKPIPNRVERYADKRKKLLKGKPATAEQLLELAELALTHALLDQFDKDMTELLKVSPDHPAAQAYKKYVTVDFKKANLPDDPASAWSDRLGSYKTDRGAPHYTLRYDSTNPNTQDLKDYLQQLEDNYRAFFSWLALHGQYLPTPVHRLTVVVQKAEDFTNLQKVFDVAALPADGFLSRRDNLAVLSFNPLDEAYEALKNATSEMWVRDRWDKNELLKGKSSGKRESSKNIARAQVVALLLKAMEEESERASVTHVGSRQLAAAVGLLPRTVASPEWIQFGTGSFFETPREAYWPGTGAPHWVYLNKFKIWHDKKKLDAPDDALRKVITDQYFLDSNQGRNKDALLRARTMSWSLTYFLAQKHLDGLMRYYQELAGMPRDLELSSDALRGAFYRAFDLGDPSQADNSRSQQLAREWYHFLDDAQLEVVDAYSVAKAKEETRIKLMEAEAQAKQKKKEQEKQKQAQQRQGGMNPFGGEGGMPATPGAPGLNRFKRGGS